MESGVRHLAGFGVLAGGFSEGDGVAGGIQDVIDDLKRQAEVAAGLAQRGSFIEMNELQFACGGVRFLFRQEVLHLPAGSAASSIAPKSSADASTSTGRSRFPPASRL